MWAGPDEKAPAPPPSCGSIRRITPVTGTAILACTPALLSIGDFSRLVS